MLGKKDESKKENFFKHMLKIQAIQKKTKNKKNRGKDVNNEVQNGCQGLLKHKINCLKVKT